MTPEQWQQVEKAFDHAIELDDTARAAFVESFSERDAVLGDKLRDLLSADGIEMDLEAPVAATVNRITRDLPDPWVGKTIGSWTVIKRIAAGGMGTVFLAQRNDDEYHAQVAIKIMAAQLLTHEAMTRFRAERQILANLNHPYIATLLDGGSTDEKLPFLVMEFVNGLPIDAHCDQLELSIDARLDLFVKVCAAVDDAHRNLIVHRDLKPTNILVNEQGEPRLLDFGIAKLLEHNEVQADAALTRQGAQVMTPEYASPEQLLGMPVTVATDVYALGVLLYRLLSGQHPYAEQLTTPAATQQAICEIDPSPPSSRIAPTGEDATRHAESNRRSRQLRGDLDNIVLKAMRKEPEQRYRSVGELSDDIGRYRQQLPVAAHPPSLRYRAGKFLRRHALGVTFAAVASAAFVALIGFYTIRVTMERDRAQLEAAKATQVAEFVAGLFSTANPDLSLGETVTARSLLDQGVLRLGELDDQPQVQATMQDVMGTAFRGLGLYDQARDLLDQALRTRSTELGIDHEDTLRSTNHVGLLLHDQGEFAQAETLFRDALELSQRAHGARGETSAKLLHGLALSLHSQARFDQADALYRDAIAGVRQTGGDESFALAQLLDDYGRLLEDLGETQNSIATLREAIALFKTVRGENHPSYLNAMQNLGYAHLSDGDPDEAQQVLQEMLDLSKRVYGDDHPFTVGCAATLATAYHYKGEYEIAEKMYRDALERFEEIFGPMHPETAIGANNLASSLQRLGRYAEAEHYYRLGLERNIALHQGNHPEVATSYSNLGVFLLVEGNIEAAGEPIRLGLEMRRELLGDDHPNTMTSVSIYATYLARAGSPESAIELMLEVIDFRREKLGEEHPHTAREIAHYGKLMRELGEFEEAREALQRSLAITRSVFTDGHAEIARTLIALAQTHAALDEHTLALASFNDARAMFEKMLGVDHPDTATGLIAIADYFNRQGRLDDARALLDHATAVRRSHFQNDDWRIAQVDSALGENLLRQGQCDDARVLLNRGHDTLRRARGARHPLTEQAAARLNMPCSAPIAGR